MTPVQKVELEMMEKDAVGLLDPVFNMPFSALAAVLAAPSGDRARAGVIGALMGAGMSALAQKELEERAARGEPVSASMLAPLFRAIISGIATGGVMRSIRDYKENGRIGTMSAVLAGAPIGAMAMGSHPIIGSILGGVTAPYLASMIQRESKDLSPEVRARAAMLAAQARTVAARRELLLRRLAIMEAIRRSRVQQKEGPAGHRP